MIRVRLLAVLTTMVALVAAVVVAPTADAAAYRYWTYWVAAPGAATWSFASAGPASLLPADGSVQGWRFAVTTAAGSASSQPRTAPSFADVCAATPAQEGRKRVALVIDPGTVDEAPPGQQPGQTTTACVVAEPDATGYQVMRAVTTVRADGSGLVCGIGGYPADECAPVIDDPVASPTAAASPAAVGSGSAMDTTTDTAAADNSTGSPVPLLAVVALVLGAGGVLFWRRRRG